MELGFDPRDKYEEIKRESNKPLPEPVQEFVRRAMESAKKAWSEDEDGGPTDSFFNTLLGVTRTPEGVVILDNFERFFDTIYLYTTDGEWKIRHMYSEESGYKPYTEEQALQDASMLYTG
jgi:hypothetical protein